MPVKSVGQFHCVSKQWCSFLSDPEFIKTHLNFHSNKHEQFKLILISDVSQSLHSLHINPNPQNGIDAISTKLSFQGKWKKIVGSCNGLVLELNEEDVTFSINPTTLEYRRISNSPLALPRCATSTAYALGFGVFLDGALHWLAGKNYCSPSVIVVVDLTNEKFFEVPIPTITTNSLLRFYGILALRWCLCALATITRFISLGTVALLGRHAHKWNEPDDQSCTHGLGDRGRDEAIVVGGGGGVTYGPIEIEVEGPEMLEDRLVLGRYNGASNKLEPISDNRVHELLLNRHTDLNLSWGHIGDQSSALQAHRSWSSSGSEIDVEVPR
uniref:F-box/kelch-repeat protein n=1 Tax=Solanum tuberosum TaxID=4113 RepID=M1DLF0_SOLTU